MTIDENEPPLGAVYAVPLSGMKSAPGRWGIVQVVATGYDPTWANLVRKVGGVESVDELGDVGGYRGGGVDSLSGDGQLEGAVALEGPDQALDG